MKIRNLMGAFLALAFAAVLPGAVRAEVEQGVIYSVDLVEGGKYGGRVPTEANPLVVNEKAVIRVRLVNANWQSPPATRVANPRPWIVMPRYPGMEEFYPLQLGLMLGGQQVYADYIETQEVVNPEAYYTDLYFSYTVKSGDLALPAYLMDAAGKPAGEGSQPEYSLLHTDMWMITNADGDKDVTADGLFHFTTLGGGMTPVPGEPQNYTPSGRKMGLYVKTIDLDRNYVEPAETEGGKDVWRKIYQGMTTTTTILPSVAVDGLSEANVFMYVWCDDPNVAAPLKTDGAQTVTDTFGEKTYTRSVLPVLVPIGASSVSFKLQGTGLGETKVRMSSSLHLVADDMDNLVTNWVERIVQVVEPPAPFVAFNLIDKSGNPLLAPVNCPTGEGYKDYVAALTITLSKAPTAAVTVHLNPTIKGEEADIFGETLLGISSTTDGTPWVNTIDEVTFNAGETSKTLYIYGLGASSGTANYGIKFTPSTTGPGKDMFDGDDHSHTANLIVKYAKPAIVSPTPEDAIEDAMAGQTYKLDVMLEDSYKDMRDEEDGYEFWYRISIGGTTGKWIGPSDLENPTDPFFPDPDSGIGSVDIAFEDEGEGTLEIYMVNVDKQDTRVKGQGVKIPISVSAPKKAWAELDRPGGYYAEGETAKVKFFLSQKTPGSKVYYAFLVPVEGSVDSTNKFNSTGFSTSVPATGGCPFAPGSLDSGDGVTEITCLDGAAVGQYDVFICTTLSYNKSKSAGYSAGRLVINATNVAPHVESVSMSGTDIDESGAIVADPIAQGVKKTFRISIGDSEPSRLDLEATGDDAFLTQWKFGSESLDWESVYGNPNLASTVTNHTFTSPGQHVVKVRVQDKDMRKSGKWSPEFSFTVTVLDAPSISIAPATEGKTVYDETDIGANASTFKVDLSVAPRFSGTEDRLYLDLTVTALGDTTKYGADDCVLSKTRLEYRSGVKTGQTFYLKELDGTTESAASGFRITAKVADDSATDVEGKKWDAGEIEINVLNVNPEIVMPAEQPKDGDKAIPYVTTVGERLSLAWALKDVVPDKRAMTVSWTTSEGKKMTYIQGEGEDTETVKYLDDVMSGTHEFWFNSSGESKSVTVMAQDKDGGVASRTIYYTIAASKTLEIVPHGPPSGNGTALSARYQDKASGLGAGKVWSKNPATIENWVFTFNCGLDSSWRIYGAGYTNGEHDVRSTPDFDYTYAPADGRDSFLYAWLQIVQEKDSAKPTDAYLAVVPEHRDAANSGTLINLPTEEAKDGGYASTIAEAIFAKEYLASDNMGDINQDGVPDIYVKKYEFGVIDNDGNVAGDDLKAITVANETGNLDNDFLPASGTSAYGSLIPGLKESWVALGKPFDAVTEIRGYHAGLNDAPAQAGIGDVTPDRIYAVDGEWRDGECTISYVECLAWQEFAAATWPDDPGAWTNAAYWTKWSPERPTDPCSPDTDDDGFEDGYEYYFWYRAHVGYIDADGVHRYLTGRAYDPRNPGEGKFIDSATIAKLMDPLVGYAGEDAETRDSDNDGLPDKLEFEIGTNPFDFDTDGDGLPDGWELCNVGNLDPLKAASHLDGKSDTARNSDGDAMAISSYALEQQQKPVPLDIRHAKRTTFAVIDPNGDTDGVQWYAVAGAPADVAVETATNGPSAVTFKADGRDFVWYGERLPVTAGGLLAATLAKGNGTVGAYVAGEQSVVTNVSEDETVTNVFRYAARGYPVRVPAGTPVTGVTTGVCPVVVQLAADIEEKDANACWIYGKGPQNALYGEVAKTAADYGCLALGRQLAAKKGARVVALPDDTRDVAFLHYLVYQEFGFDPRTAWKAKDPLATRWSKSIDGESVEGITQLKQGGYTGAPSRTRDYANYDEFLVYSFFVNNGCKMSGKTRITDPKADPLVVIWDMFTTNPQGPNEILPATSGGTEGGETAAQVTSYGRGTNGADTDFDGVPDGWELYVMSGPKKNGAYVFAHPYAGFATGLNPAEEMPESYFSPFLDFAKGTETSNQIYLGGEANDDTLNEFKEFEGTDSIAYYAVAAKEGDLPYSTTVVHEGNWTWFNKFFPTDPWNVDTDQDGLKDNEEKGAFAYGTPADDGKLWSIPGGGLNPCSVDTDLDGLPDGWELQFKPENYSKIYAGEFADYAKDETGAAVGNPLQGLTDGMDGTVKDAFSYPIEYADSAAGGTNVTTYVIADGFKQVVNRDYDRDGLENWQEYLTGTMRCWRYDDPLSTWSYIPKELYFKHDEKTDTWTFKPDYAALGVEDRNEFWYRTLVDRSSPLYNPGLVTDSSPAMYFSRVVNVWDCAYLDATLSGKRPGAYYWFKDRIGADTLTDLWGAALLTVAGADTLQKPSRYASCSPIDPDSDHDGMDDYYELFHGMNPLLGKSGVRMAENGPCDLVYDSWTGDGGDSFSAWGGPDGKKPNLWQLDPVKAAEAASREGSNGYDFEVYPWLNGLADADPDGDILPNQEEALLPKLSKIAFHTDPTPVWMTDTSYSNSLTRMFFRLPARFEDAATGGATFVFGGETNSFSSFDGWLPAAGMTPAHFVGFIPDAWTLAAAGKMNWMYSFEENEGYDSDHDGISDFEEKEGLFRTATDPQDADSPRRRQAMYFQGPSKPSALQTMPFVDELYPTQRGYPDDIAFVQFSAECWVKPESLADSIVLERAVWTGLSSPADKEYMRKNFQLGIRTGADGRSYWFAKYDPVGTAGDTHEVVALSKSPADATKWTHLAATYDGTALVLYVNGKESRTVKSELPPSWGAGVIALTEDTQDFWFDREHELKAIIIGAGAKTQKQGAKDGNALDVTQGRGFDRYTGFFTGWIDEVRIWDGARTATEIASEWNVRYTAELAAKNRSDFYDEWKTGKRRYEKDGSGKDVTMLAELRFHWAFDSIFGAQNEEALAASPHAFDGQRAKLSRPADYGIAWWQTILNGYGSLYDFGRADWVSWIPNTVTHLPRFDGTTLDSVYWCEDFEGAAAGTFRFARTAEPVSLWTQYVRNGVKFETEYQTTGSRHFEFNTGSHENGTQFATLFRFTGRNLNQSGDDLLPLGGAYAKYCDAATDLWDGQGPSTNWEITGDDPDGDGLPKWWEEYADENYRGTLPPTVDIGWKTIIDYNGMAITAGEAYLRDLAKGSYMNEFGEAVIGDDNYLQIADEDANGVPDWWADIYGIRGESGLADHDNDGLPNYVEYLLSEVFQFNVQFDPTVADSVQEGIPDYFYRPEGCQLYVGEIFTDHDLVDDAWEDLYDEKELLDDEKYASRLAWDALADTDQDGWSNRSENRYAKAVMPIVANKREHNTPADGLVADYPIPTIALKLSYNGNRQYDVSEAPIAVQVTTGATLAKDPDATYLIGAAADKTAGTGTDSSTEKESAASAEVARTRTIGKWSDRRVIGTLTPGNIKIDSIKLQNCYDPSSVTYSWKLLEGERAGQIKRGTHAEYNDDLRKYGSANVELLSMTAGYKDLQDLELRGDEKSVMATWFLTQTGDTLGTVNLVTGEFSLDLGKFRNWTVHDGTNENERAAMEDQTFRIAYATNPSVGLPRELYLGEADTGHVKEGKNTIIAWAETVAADGKWQVGEPYGIVRDVDVSWRGTKAEIELTDLSPVTPRIDLTAAGSSSGGASSGGQQQGQQAAGDPTAVDAASDRGETVSAIKARIREQLEYDYSGASPVLYSNALERLAWMEGNIIDPATITPDTFRNQRLRVVRWLINDVPTYRAGTSSRVVLDKQIETDVRSCLTEADFLVGNGSFDLDWDNLYGEVINNMSVSRYCGEVRSVSYLIVVGDGPVDWDAISSSNYTVRALNSVIVRKFGENRVTPVAVAPGAVSEEIVHGANPTFKWTMNCPEEEGYTAFNIQVMDGSTLVYDSDKQLAPPRNAEGQYVWEAPLYVGDKTLKGKVFENKKAYTWKVSMYNAKFSNEAVYSNAGRFLMEVQTNGYTYGTANVAVRYFGPKSSYQKSYQKKDVVIRVRAYTSPDFTGLPVAAGYVANPDDPANGLTAGTNAAPNCTVVGIPKGTYYLQAFIDSNANGACDPWETQGYLCTRDGSTPDYLDPTAITFDSKVGKGDLAVIYLEDADTDADGLPDAWEYAEYGSLTAKGVELLSETKAGEFVVNTAISGALKLQENAKVPTAGLAGEIRNTMTKLRSPVGVSAATGIDPADVEVTDGGLVVKSEIDPETLTIVGFAVDAVQNRVLLKVGAETTADINPTVANFLNITVKKGAEVTVKVEHAESPNGPWTELKGVDGTVTVDRAGADIEVKLNGELPAQGYFRAKVEE